MPWLAMHRAGLVSLRFLAGVFYFEELHKQLKELGWAMGVLAYGGETSIL